MTVPPFVMRDRDGQWTGISIELWTRIADRLRLGYRLVEYKTLAELIGAVARGELDVAVGALTITAPREDVLDFSQPYYVTGLGIAVPTHQSAPLLLPFVRAMSSFRFGQAALGLLALAGVLSLIIVLIEYANRQPASGSGHHGRWWSAHSPVPPGSLRPRTLPGRVLGAILAAVVTVALVTVGAAIALTWASYDARHPIATVSDLTHVKVGTVANSSSSEFLSSESIKFQSFSTPVEGLDALRQGTLDAFVFDKPLLAWAVLQQFSSSVEVLDTSFDLQSYAFALKQDSPLRSRVDPLIIEISRSEKWRHVLYRYLGENE
ncbi:transporter substrate-binding domain-containing protein [Rhodoligotrophos ferricapiens]|uniref:transporter substrate-binding domain-containing protein n=1 Tax=Rhodoligotrophos ferricapiens TaxID=3069264 RepID=UPI00315C7276